MNGRSEVEEDSPSQSYQQIGENHLENLFYANVSASCVKIISDDDEIDYSSKPEFYDPRVDDKDELWVKKLRRGRTSDAVLSCPACFTTLCLDCQRHEKYVTQYRAICVVNCRIKEEVSKPGSKRKGNKSSPTAAVCCSVCSTNVGVIDEDETYHFLNVLPSEA